MRHSKNIIRNIIPVQQTISKSFKRKVSNDMSKFKEALKGAKEVVVLTGAGISAESGVPTFRTRNSIWRDMSSTVLFNASVFKEDPGFIWEFFHYCRELVMKTKPNAGHKAIADYQAKHADKKVTILTQNIDDLHAKAGSKNIIELHGSLFKTRCTKCDDVLVNTDSPICEALRGTGSPMSTQLCSYIKEADLPHCKKPNCGGLLRPHIVFFGEMLDWPTVNAVDPVISNGNVLLVVGTSSLVFPAAAYAAVMLAGGSIVAEFNIDPGPANSMFDYYFSGPSATTLPLALSD